MYTNILHRGRQKGVTLWTLVFGGLLLLFLVILVAKLFPSVREYWSLTTVLNTIAKEAAQNSKSDAEILDSFDRHARIEDFESVGRRDLKIARSREGVVTISFAYEKRIPLVGSVSLLIDYSGSGKGDSK
ncbi:MAG: DUF4845 domain-containing protein [Zoogloeaceae bacterium]|jgi:hypothetical protein|nr:DUF4845 domain-containing protein [Zoogloeaceae bacterium]